MSKTEAYNNKVKEAAPIGSTIEIEHPLTFKKVTATVTGYELAEAYQDGGEWIFPEAIGHVVLEMPDGKVGHYSTSLLFESDPLKTV